MWKAIQEILTSSNGSIIAILFVLVVVLVIGCAKLGLIKIQTDKISVGNNASDVERTIVRNQIEWCKTSIYAYEKQIPRFEGYDEYLGKYIGELVFDEIVKWIVLNHIEDKKTYIGIKQEIVWNIIQARVKDDNMRTDEFKDFVYRYVEHVIKNLVSIRNEYRPRY